MGLILLLLAAGTIAFIAGPALVIALAIVVRTRRTRSFWPLCAVVALVSFAAQYLYALAPLTFVGTHEYSWGLFFSPMFGWHLLVPPVVAAVVWLISRRFQLANANAVIAGLFFSVAAVVILAIPIGLALPRVLGLRFSP